MGSEPMSKANLDRYIAVARLFLAIAARASQDRDTSNPV